MGLIGLHSERKLYKMTNIPNNYSQYSNSQMPKPTPYQGGQTPVAPQPMPQASMPTTQPQPQAYRAPQPIPTAQPQQAHMQSQSYQAAQSTPTQARPTQSTGYQAPATAVPSSAASAQVQGYNQQVSKGQQQPYPTQQPQMSASVQMAQGHGAGQDQDHEPTERDQEFEKEDKKLYHKRTRIVKFATNKTYFEVFNFGFKHGRIAIKMSNYKPQYSEILISLKIGEYLELKDLIMSGAIHHCQPDNYKNLHAYNKGTGSRYSKDGTVLARQFAVQAANDPSKYVVTFIGKEGPGKEDHKKLIQFTGKPNTTVIYPMTRAMLVELFNTVDMHLQGYINACYNYQFNQLPYFTKE